MENLLDLLPPGATVFGTVLVLAAFHLILSRRPDAALHRFRNQMLMLALTAIGLLVVLLVLPLSEATRGQLLSFLGLLISATFALSSTTFLGNALAGLMLRTVKNFRVGDFVRAGDHFGRVSERGLFHVELQTEDRELTTLPNLFLVTNPVTTVRSSGTIISTTVSLGYDVPRGRVEELLLDAAEKAGLTDGFVQILELGDFSVLYRIAGLLTEIKTVISAKSRLRGAVMDSLHAGGVEIVSPSFMNTRPLEKEQRFVPPVIIETASEPEAGPAPEELVFDKAEEAESKQAKELDLQQLTAEMADLEANLKAAADGEKPEIEARLQTLAARREALKQEVEAEGATEES